MRFINKRVSLIALIAFSMADPAKPADTIDRYGRNSDRAPSRQKYVKQTFGAGSVVRAGAGAAIEQKLDTPHEWGQGAAGYGKRLGSAFSKHIVHKSIQYTVARLRHEEFGYRPSGKQGFKPRLKYALLATVVTRKTTTGKSTIAAGELSGAFGSGLISRLWQPASTRTIATGVGSGGITLAVDAGTHVLREFWPEIRHPHRHSVATNVSKPKALR